MILYLWHSQILVHTIQVVCEENGCFKQSRYSKNVTTVAFCPSYSAAKAPFLARFKVKRCGIQGLEKMGMLGGGEDNGGSGEREDNNKEEWMLSIPEWQACIFKVGDDVRQVRIGAGALFCFACLFVLFLLKITTKQNQIFFFSKM